MDYPPINGPNHLGPRCNALPEYQMARLTSGLRALQSVAERKMLVARDSLAFGAGPHNMDYSPTRWPESPRIVMQCAPRASNGPNHLGNPAFQ